MALCLQLFLWFGCVWFTMPLVAGQTCYLGQELKPMESLRWGLSAKDPCTCSKIDIGGVNIAPWEETMLPHSISLDMADAKDIKEAFQCDEVEDFKLPLSCRAHQQDGQTTSGVYGIFIPGTVSDQANYLPVYCDMDTDGEGWIVMFRRHDGSTDFNRTWVDYRNGFGNLAGEFWLGNELVVKLTQAKVDNVLIEWEIQLDLWTVPHNIPNTCCSKLHVCDVAVHHYKRYHGFTLEKNEYRFKISNAESYQSTALFEFLPTFNNMGFMKTACSAGGYWWENDRNYGSPCLIIANRCYGSIDVPACKLWDIWPNWDNVGSSYNQLCKSEIKIRPMPVRK